VICIPVTAKTPMAKMIMPIKTSINVNPLLLKDFLTLFLSFNVTPPKIGCFVKEQRSCHLFHLFSILYWIEFTEHFQYLFMYGALLLSEIVSLPYKILVIGLYLLKQRSTVNTCQNW